MKRAWSYVTGTNHVLNALVRTTLNEKSVPNYYAGTRITNFINQNLTL